MHYQLTLQDVSNDTLTSEYAKVYRARFDSSAHYDEYCTILAELRYRNISFQYLPV